MSLDPSQFAELVRDHHAMVYRLCYRHLRHHEDAVDATQQVFTKLFVKGDTVHTAVGPWLRRTAVNTAITHLRSEIARRRHERAYEPVQPPRARGPMEDDELKRLVSQCLAALEPRDREAAVRHLMVGEPQASIAADWGVTQQAVGKRVRRVRDELRRRLRRVGVTSLGTAIAAALPTRLVSAGVARAIGLTIGLKPSHGLVPAAAVALLMPAAQAPDRSTSPTPIAPPASSAASPPPWADPRPSRLAAQRSVATPAMPTLRPPRTVGRAAGVAPAPSTMNRIATPPAWSMPNPRARPTAAAHRPSFRPPPASVAAPRRHASLDATPDAPKRRHAAAAANRPTPPSHARQHPRRDEPAPPPDTPLAKATDPRESAIHPSSKQETIVPPRWADLPTPRLNRPAPLATIVIQPAPRPETVSFLLGPRVVSSRWAATIRPDRAIARDDRFLARIGQEAPLMQPIHLRDFLRTPVLAAVSALPGATAIAGTTVVDPDADAYAALLDNAAYDSVGMVTAGNSLGSGVYLGDGWVLTAAHVADASDDLAFTVDGVDYAVGSVHLHEDWTGDLTAGNDLALVRLDAVDPAIEAARLYEPTVTEPVGEVVTFVGYGRTGDGDTGATGSAGEKHAGQNTLDAFGGDHFQLRGYDDSIFFVDFDDPTATSDGLWWSDDQALALEYLIAPGDSGGGAFVDVDGVTYLVGINSFLAATDGAADADYGDLGGLIYVPDHADWIFGITGVIDTGLGVAAVPEPGLAASLALLGAAAAIRRRRRIDDPTAPAR